MVVVVGFIGCWSGCFGWWLGYWMLGLVGYGSGVYFLCVEENGFIKGCKCVNLEGRCWEEYDDSVYSLQE